MFNAIQNIGNILGLPFAPYVSDLLGRRNALILACTIMIVATIIQTAAKNVGMFIAARGLIGFGLSFANIAAPVLITELAFPTHRGPITSLYNSCWFLGAIVAAWTTYGTFRIQNTWSWRIPSLLQVCVAEPFPRHSLTRTRACPPLSSSTSSGSSPSHHAGWSPTGRTTRRSLS